MSWPSKMALQVEGLTYKWKGSPTSGGLTYKLEDLCSPGTHSGSKEPTPESCPLTFMFILRPSRMC